MQACLTSTQLEDLANGTMTEQDRRSVMPHLGECDQCSSTVAMLLSRGDGPIGLEPVSLLKPGQRLGRYLIVERAGGGAFGTVYRAFDPLLARSVAIKVLHPELTSIEPQLVDEARALARLSHPNVVTVFEVGDEQGLTFLVMELVEGQTLEHWFTTKPRWQAVVERMIDAARGLEGAHAAGLVHGDFKPSNVLLGKDLTVKVADFGLGHAHAAPSAPELLKGTPAFSAPELFAGKAADPSSDQFSFGVTLYLALYGVRPFKGSTVGALAQAMERGELAQPASSVRLPGWLETVVKRCLGPREQRFASMKAVRLALSRDTSRRQLRAAIGVLGVLTLTSAGIAWAQRYEHQRTLCVSTDRPLHGVWNDEQREKLRVAFGASSAPFAASAIKEVERGLDRYATGWATARAEACEATRNGEQSSALLDLKNGCLDQRLLELRSLIQVLQGDATVVEGAPKAVAGLSSTAGCGIAPQTDARVLALPEPLRQRISEVSARWLTGQFDQARHEATALLEAPEIKGSPSEGDVRFLLGKAEASLEHHEQASGQLREVVVLAEAADNQTLAIRASSRLGDLLSRRMGRPADGLHWLRLARAKLTRLGENPELEGDVLARLGTTHFVLNDFEQAQLELRRSLVLMRQNENQALVATGTQMVLANVLISLHRNDEAIEMGHATVAEVEAMLGSAHPHTAEAHNNLGGVLYTVGDYAGASRENLLALRILEGARGPDSPAVGWALDGRGLCLSKEKKLDEAKAAYTRAASIFEKAYGPKSPLFAQVLGHLGEQALNSGDFAAALVTLSQTVAIMRAGEPVDAMALAEVLMALSEALVEMHKPAEAVAASQEALALAEQTVGPADAGLSKHLLYLGRALISQGRAAAALAHLERALTLAAKEPPESTDRAAIEASIGCALGKTGGDAKRAEALLRQTRERLSKADTADPVEARFIASCGR